MTPGSYKITDLNPQNHHHIHAAAELLHVESVLHWPEAWPTLASALEEIKEMLGPDRIVRIAADENDAVLGWIGGIKQYAGHTWELHPLVVHPEHRSAGIATALVKDLEKQVLARGGTSLYLGADDEDGRTSIGERDIYPNVLGALQGIRNVGGHPFEFYQKVGFVIVGVIPDAGGAGKHDIFMAKRLTPKGK